MLKQEKQLPHYDTCPEGKPKYTCSVCNLVHNVKTEQNNCSHCSSRPRTRTLPVLISRILPSILNEELVKDKALLAFSASASERMLLKSYFSKIQVVTLYGNYGSDSIEGVDATDLSRFQDNSFCAVYSLSVYDYIYEIKQALSEAYRVISAGGIFMALILETKLKDDASEVVITNQLKGHASNKMHYLPKDTDMVKISVGKEYFIKLMNEVGFQDSKIIDVYDEISDVHNTWFIGEKANN